MPKDSKKIKAELQEMKGDSGKAAMKAVISGTEQSRDKAAPKISKLLEAVLPSTIGAAAGAIAGPEVVPAVKAAVSWTGIAKPLAKGITWLIASNTVNETLDPRARFQKWLAESDDGLAGKIRSGLDGIASKTGLSQEQVYSLATFQLPPKNMDQFWDYFADLVPTDAINAILDGGDIKSEATQQLLSKVLEDKAGVNLASLTSIYEKAQTAEGGKELVGTVLTKLLGDKCNPKITEAVVSLIKTGIDAAQKKGPADDAEEKPTIHP